MLANRAGTFLARTLDLGVAESRSESKLLMATIRLGLDSELQDDGEFMDVSGEQLEITAFVFLEKKDGSINDFNVRALREAYGWDGVDPFWLQDTDHGGRLIQVELGFETYNGKQRLKVKYLRHKDATGNAVSKCDDTAKRGIQVRLGMKFRALASTMKVSEPAHAAAPATQASQPNPALPPKPPKFMQPPAETPPANHGTATEDEAWAACLAAAPATIPNEELESQWFKALKKIVPGKDVVAFTPEDWGKVKAEISENILPF